MRSTSSSQVSCRWSLSCSPMSYCMAFTNSSSIGSVRWGWFSWGCSCCALSPISPVLATTQSRKNRRVLLMILFIYLIRMGSCESRLLQQELKNFKEVKKVENSVYGQAAVYEEVQTGRQLAVYFLTNSDLHMQRLKILRFEEQLAMPHDLLVNLRLINKSVQRVRCGTTYVIECAYDYYPHSLKEQLSHRKYNQAPFSESELLYLLLALLSAARFYLEHHLPYEISLEKVLLDSAGRVKVLQNLVLEDSQVSSYDRLKMVHAMPQKYGQVLVSPAQLESIKNERRQLQHDPERTQVFQLGLMMLQVACLDDSTSFYDYSSLNIDQAAVEGCIQQAQSLYSPQLLSLLKMLINPFQDQVSLAHLLNYINNLTVTQALQVAPALQLDPPGRESASNYSQVFKQ